jgi:para-nitrobenzyl esterase
MKPEENNSTASGLKSIIALTTALFCLLLIFASNVQADTKLIRTTANGEVEGTIDPATKGLVWKGIGYAKPPVEDLRWKAPVDPESWEGVREANEYGEICSQRNWSGSYMGGENCLVLDIYRPDTPAEDLPVYVWIHGGSNETGGSKRSNLSYFARETNVVAVVIQYRLGPLGFFMHPALKTNDTGGDSGNFGLLDQMAALKWVQKNIASFGGDPNRVTVAGESAGAHDIVALMTVKEAEGFFQQVIYQSGGMIPRNPDVALAQSEKYIEKLELSSKGQDLARALRAIPAEDFLKAKPAGARFGVIVDGTFLADSHFCLVESGQYNKVPIMMGGNRNEYSLWLTLGKGPEGKWSKLLTMFYNVNTPLSELLTSEEQKTYALANAFTGQIWQARHVHKLARSLRKHQDNVYVYDFRWGGTKDTDVEKVFGAAHANEIAFFHFNATFDIWARNASITPLN